MQVKINGVKKLGNDELESKKKVCFEIMTITNLLKRHVDNNTGMKCAERYTGNNIWILGYLFHNRDRDVFQKDLEEAFSVRRSTVSKAIKLMEQKELITRESVDYDARLKKLVLTEKALHINEAIKSQLVTMEEKIIFNLTDEEVVSFLQILSKIRKSLESESKKNP